MLYKVAELLCLTICFGCSGTTDSMGAFPRYELTDVGDDTGQSRSSQCAPEVRVWSLSRMTPTIGTFKMSSMVAPELGGLWEPLGDFEMLVLPHPHGAPHSEEPPSRPWHLRTCFPSRVPPVLDGCICRIS